MGSYERVLGNASADPASMAIATCNLGTLNEMRGDMRAACENWRKALALFRQVGMPVQIEQGGRLDARGGLPRLIPTALGSDSSPLILSFSRKGRRDAAAIAAACSLSPCGRGLG
jgi:hypothetical protein